MRDAQTYFIHTLQTIKEELQQPEVKDEEVTELSKESDQRGTERGVVRE